MYNETQFISIVWTLWSVALVTSIGRVILRHRIQGQFHADDYFALLGFIFLSALTAVVTVATPIFEMERSYLLAAASNPLTPLPLPEAQFVAQTVKSLKLMFAQMLLFWSTLWAGKFSLLVFFRNMVIGIPKYMYIWWAVFTLVLLTYLACMLSNFLTCAPLDKYWSATGCSSPDDLKRSDASIKFATAADIFADFLVMLLPLRLLWNLQISRKQKVALGCMFSLGIIVIVFAFVRLSNVTKATSQAKTNPTTLANGPILLSLWSTIEAAVAVLVANLPAFRSLLRTASNTRRTNSPRTKPSNLTAYAHGSHATTSRSAIKRHSMELESLHSTDEIFGRTREHDRGFEMNKKSHTVMTTDINVDSRERREGDALEASNRKLGLTL